MTNMREVAARRNSDLTTPRRRKLPAEISSAVCREHDRLDPHSPRRKPTLVHLRFLEQPVQLDLFDRVRS